MVEVESILPGSSGSAPIAKNPSPPRSGQTQPGAAIATPLPETATIPGETTSGSGAVIPDMAPSAPEPAPTAAPARVPVTTEAGRVYLQLGAFGSRENAEGYRARVQSQADGLTLQILARDGLYRVQAGPYANQDEARAAADRLATALGIKPMVLTR